MPLSQGTTDAEFIFDLASDAVEVREELYDFGQNNQNSPPGKSNTGLKAVVGDRLDNDPNRGERREMERSSHGHLAMLDDGVKQILVGSTLMPFSHSY